MKKLMATSLLALSTLFTLVGCNNGSGSSPAATPAANYVYTNGSCYNSSAATYVSSAYCTSTNTGAYYYSNGSCYSSVAAQIVSPSYCATTGTGGSYYIAGSSCYSSNGQLASPSSCINSAYTGQTGGQCFGTYIFVSNGYPTVGQCSGSNCSGYTMLTYPGQQRVYCQ